MEEGDEQVDIETDDVQIDARNVYVNNGWTPRMAFWNTAGTLLGAFSGVAALVLSTVAIWIGLR